MITYLVLFIISLTALFTIDLWPLYQVIFAKSNLDLAALIFLGLSWGLWWIGAFASVLIFDAVQKRFHLPPIPRYRTMMMIFLINFIGALSIFPGIQLYILARDQIKVAGFKVEVKLLEDALEERVNPDGNSTYYYKYKIEVDNKSGRIYDDVTSGVSLMLKTDKPQPLSILTLVDPTYIGPVQKGLPRGKKVLEGSLPLAFSLVERGKRYPVKIGVGFGFTGTRSIGYYLDPKVPGLDDFVYSHAQ